MVEACFVPGGAVQAAIVCHGDAFDNVGAATIHTIEHGAHAPCLSAWPTTTI